MLNGATIRMSFRVIGRDDAPFTVTAQPSSSFTIASIAPTSSSLSWVQPAWFTGMKRTPASSPIDVLSAPMIRLLAVLGALANRPS